MNRRDIMTTDLEEVVDKEYTMGEFEEMDLTKLHGKTFMVAMNTGGRDKPQFLCSTLCGPFDFYAMIETVGIVYEEQQAHAKVLICSDTFGTPPEILDENTVDFIEARSSEIIMDGVLGGGLMEKKDYTCKAGFITLPDESEEK
jgi:hypothetical protein